MVFLVILVLYSGWLMVNTAEHCTANHTTDHCQKGIQLHELHKKQCLSICPSLCYQQRLPKATEILLLQVVHKSLRSVGGAQAQRPDKEKPMVPKENLVPRVVGTLKTGAVFLLCVLGCPRSYPNQSAELPKLSAFYLSGRPHSTSE